MLVGNLFKAGRTWIKEYHPFNVVQFDCDKELESFGYTCRNFVKCCLINRKRSLTRTKMTHTSWRDLCTLRAKSGCRHRTVWWYVFFAGSASQCQLMWYTHGWMALIWHFWRNWRQSRSKWKRNKELLGLTFNVLDVFYFLAQGFTQEPFVFSHLSSSALAYKPTLWHYYLQWLAHSGFDQRSEKNANNPCFLLKNEKWKG